MERKRRLGPLLVRATMYSLVICNVNLWLAVLMRLWLVANRDNILIFVGIQLGAIFLTVGLLFFFRWLDRMIYR
ncbi:MAG: hypothetical protein M3P98_04505 [bacterium]|nr:hypothetical protein [bacterium]